MNGSMVQMISLLEESSREALDRATKLFSDKDATGGKSVLKDFISSSLSKNTGTFASTFIRAFLQTFSETESKPRNIKTLVTDLVREPLLTGLEQLRVASQTGGFLEKEKHFRIERFRSALLNLDRARSLALEDYEVAIINLLRGLCVFGIPGGASEAIIHLTAFQIWAHGVVASLASVKEQKELDMARVDAEMRKLKPLLRQRENTPVFLALQRGQVQAESLTAELKEIMSTMTKVLDVNLYVWTLSGVAQKIVKKEG